MYEWLSCLNGIVDLGETLGAGKSSRDFVRYVFCRMCISGHAYVTGPRIVTEHAQKMDHPVMRALLARGSMMATAQAKIHTNNFINGPTIWAQQQGLQDGVDSILAAFNIHPEILSLLPGAKKNHDLEIYRRTVDKPEDGE